MTTERIQIVVSDSGTVTVKKNIAGVGNAAKEASGGINFLKGAIAALLSAQTIKAFYNLGDANIQLTNALKTTGLAGQALADQQTRLFEIAKQNGQDVNELTGIYQRLVSVQGQLDASGQDIDKTLQVIGASMRMSSSGAAAQAGALQQLQQLLGGTNVQAQEFNALIDGAYPLLQAVAAGSERWGGNVAALTRDVKAGTVTTKEFYDALLKGGDANIALAQSFDLTVGQALTNFRTNVQQALVTLQNMTGIFTGTGNAINFFANNLSIVVALLSPLIAGLTFLGVSVLAGAVSKGFIAAYNGAMALYKGILLLNGVILANPWVAAFTAIVAVIATVITYTVGWQAALQGVIDLVNMAIGAVENLAQVLGSTVKDGDWQIKINGEEAATAITEAAKKVGSFGQSGVTVGGKTAGDYMRKAVGDGGKDAATTLADAQAAGVARYEALNGKAVQALGDTLVDGGKFIYNQATGATTKGAADIGKAVETSGTKAGDSMGQAITQAGQKVGTTIFNTVESAFASLAPLMDVFTQARLNLMQERALMASEIAKNNADARLTMDQINNPSKYRDRGSSGTGTTFANSGGQTSNTVTGGPAFNGLPVANNNAPQDSSSSSVSIINVTDPNDLVAINTSKTGQKAIINVLKTNREEIQAILGVGG